MGVKNSVHAITRASFDTSTLTANYQIVDTSGLEFACFALRFINISDSNIDLSYDGTNDHDIIPANSSIPINTQTNHTPYAGIAYFSKGTKIYVKGAATAGTFYIVGYYQDPGN